jgi:hypothetical protein
LLKRRLSQRVLLPHQLQLLLGVMQLLPHVRGLYALVSQSALQLFRFQLSGHRAALSRSHLLIVPPRRRCLMLRAGGQGVEGGRAELLVGRGVDADARRRRRCCRSRRRSRRCCRCHCRCACSAATALGGRARTCAA